MLGWAQSSESSAALQGPAATLAETSGESVRAQLERILASAVFSRSQKLSRFLRFSVEHALDGNADNLKEYSIALAVYDRGASFDPAIDPIVRVEARRLRLTLQKYYETEGCDDPLRIDIPKGHYAPLFEKREAVRGAQSPAGLASLANAVVVLPFENLSPEPEREYLCDGITEELIAGLSQTRRFRVVARTTAFAFKRVHQDVRKIGQGLHVGTAVEGSVRSSGDLLRITVQIINVADGYHLWSQQFDRNTKDVFAIQAEIARVVVNALGILLIGAVAKRHGEIVR